MSHASKGEVLIVGAGPTGLITALLLAQHGVPTRIIDQKSRTATRSYACVLHPASFGLLERVGVAGDVMDLGRRIECVGIYNGASRSAEARLSELPGRNPFAVVLAQFLLEELLEEKLRIAGVQVEWHRRLLELQCEPDGVTAVVEKIEAGSYRHMMPDRDEEVGETFPLNADYLVAADGHHSTVRRLLGINSVEQGPAQRFTVFEIETLEPVSNEIKLVFGDWGVSAFWPLADYKCRWGFQMAGDGLGEGNGQPTEDRGIIVEAPRETRSKSDLQGLLAERAPWFRHGVRDINWVAQPEFRNRKAASFGEGRCWLAGDAAHRGGPIGAQSLNQGLREAADLADKLNSIWRSEADGRLLQDFDSTQQAQWGQLVDLSRQSPPANGFPSWLHSHWPTLSASLPATGEELNYLLNHLHFL